MTKVSVLCIFNPFIPETDLELFLEDGEDDLGDIEPQTDANNDDQIHTESEAQLGR